MAEAFPAGQTQTAETSSGERAASPELSILLFNVSGNGNSRGMAAAQREAIARVLDSEELAVDSSSLFILCTDNVSRPKKQAFYHRLGLHGSQRKNKHAVIFVNKMAKSDFKPEGCTEDIPRELQSVTERVETARSEDAAHSTWLNSPSFQSLAEVVDECITRLSIVKITSAKYNKKILLVSWHGPNTGKTAAKKVDYLEKLIDFVEELRSSHGQDVVLIGGDFNIPSDSDAISASPQVPMIQVFKSADKLMYVLVWPEGHLELLPGFPQTVPLEPPSVTLGDGTSVVPFDHVIVLYRFRGVAGGVAGGVTGGVAGEETGEMMATAGADIPGQEQTSDSDIRRLAKTLLKEGRMPLLQPAKRRWERDEQVTLPGGTRWPPRDYQSKSSKTKLELTELAIGIMTVTSPKKICRDDLDEWGMLLLPFTALPRAESPAQQARGPLFDVVSRVALGEDCSPEGERVVRTLSLQPKPEGLVAEVTEVIRDVPLRIS